MYQSYMILSILQYVCIVMALNIKPKRTRYPVIEDRYEVMETLGAG